MPERLGTRAPDQDPCLVFAADPGVWSLVRLPPRRALVGHGRLDDRRHQPVLAGLALALVRFVDQAPGRTGARASTRATIMVSTSARSSPIATCPGTTRGFTSPSRSRSACGPGRHRNRAWLEEPPRRSVSVAPGGNDRGVSGHFQHASAGLRRRTSFSPRLSGMGDADRSRFRMALGPRLSGRRGRIALAAFLLVQAVGVVALHPFGLSYYNALVGGLPGAERLGLELTYWNDPVDQVLLDRLAREASRGTSAALVPTLYPGQGILTTNRTLAHAGSSSRTNKRPPAPNGWSFRAEPLTGGPRSRTLLRRRRPTRSPARSRQGVWLAALWHFPDTSGKARSRVGRSVRFSRDRSGRPPRRPGDRWASRCRASFDPPYTDCGSADWRSSTFK